MTHRWRLSALVFGVGVTLLATSSLTSCSRPGPPSRPSPSGLVNPRGLNFGPDGALYVAEAGSGGSGPCILGSDGLTNATDDRRVTKIVLGGPPGVVTDRSVDQLAVNGPVGAGIAPGRTTSTFKGSVMDTSRSALGADPGQAAGLRRSRRSVVNSAGLIRFQPNGKWSFEEILRPSRTSRTPTASTSGLQSLRPARRARPHHLHGRRRQFAQRRRGQWFDLEPGRVSHAAQRRFHPSRQFRPRSPWAPTETCTSDS